VNNRITIDNVNVGVEEFQLSEAQSSSFTGKPVKINFNKEAYPAAKKASEKTGVDIGLILGIFDQETGSGRAGIAGTGRCRINEVKANAYPADKTALAQIASELGKNVNDLPVSCSFQKADGTYAGHGGAVGYAQSLPTTWNAHKAAVKQNLGKSVVDPWNIEDALMFIAVFMKQHGGIASPYNGACAYFGQCVFGGVDYAGQVVNKMNTFKKEIADKKAKGLIQ
jgi:membrane-bound lytic murein transglycosylase B